MSEWFSAGVSGLWAGSVISLWQLQRWLREGGTRQEYGEERWNMQGGGRKDLAWLAQQLQAAKAARRRSDVQERGK